MNEREAVERLADALKTSNRLRQAVREALAEPGDARWVLVEGYHDSGAINAVYGPYSEAHIDWLLAGLLQYHSGCNWTKHKLSNGPEES